MKVFSVGIDLVAVAAFGIGVHTELKTGDPPSCADYCPSPLLSQRPSAFPDPLNIGLAGKIPEPTPVRSKSEARYEDTCGGPTVVIVVLLE
jgi:hypothetical protein